MVQCNVLLLCIPYLRKWLFEAHSLSMRTNNRKINYKKDQMFLWPWHMIISYVAYYPLKWTIKKKFIFFQWKDLSNATDNIKRNCNNYERQRQIDTSQILNATDNIKRKCNHYERQRQNRSMSNSQSAIFYQDSKSLSTAYAVIISEPK